MQCLMRDAVKPCQEAILTPDQDPPETRDAAMRDVLVVFADAPEKKLLRGLKPGFRHCFVVMSGARTGDWICLDPQSHRVACDIWQYSVLFDPEAYYRGRGFDCVWVSYPAEVPKRVRFGAFTCVEFVKRLLGISGFWIITPHQLFQALRNPEEIGYRRRYQGDVFFSEKCS
ncbi:hypothetical protein [Thalassospira alkalitolerans]|uniref:hypothetical protein n=1 Tax=Thalassospira alkalitolerans TaxID=1293890 RepID=UPI003AA7CC26